MAQAASGIDCAVSVTDHPTARAEAALTHPATLFALATLLVNDLLFKSLWPGSWWTGKLSDLAWVIFASPLLALPLTFLARRNPIAQKTAWAIAYIGLPLLYAAYNTIEPLHDVIMEAFSLLRGTPGGSPFDPTDSVVIPLGLATAIWIWRNAKVDSKAVRLRAGLLLAALASLASVATSFSPPYLGVVDIEADADGNPSYIHGWEWEQKVSRRFVDTPRGIFTIHQGTNIHRSYNGVGEIVFSTIIKNERRDQIALRASTINHGYSDTSVSPYSIFYDEPSGNVILAMGLQGVIIGKPDGTWERTPVEELKPLDYSIASRLTTLLRITELIFISAGLAASFMVFSLILTTRSSVTSGESLLVSLTALIPVAVSIIALLQFSDNRNPQDSYDLVAAIPSLTPFIAWMLPIPFVFAISKLKFLTAATVAIVAFIGMFVLSEFAFYLWVNGIIDLDRAKLWSMALTASGAVVLGVWTISHVRAQRDVANIRLSKDQLP